MTLLLLQIDRFSGAPSVDIFNGGKRVTYTIYRWRPFPFAIWSLKHGRRTWDAFIRFRVTLNGSNSTTGTALLHDD